MPFLTKRFATTIAIGVSLRTMVYKKAKRCKYSCDPRPARLVPETSSININWHQSCKYPCFGHGDHWNRRHSRTPTPRNHSKYLEDAKQARPNYQAGYAPGPN